MRAGSDTVRRRAGRPAKPLDPSASEIAFLGYQLRHDRGRRGLTQAELADGTGYSVQHIGAVERGEALPSASFVASCDQALQTGGRLAGLLPAAIREQAALRHGRTARRRDAPAQRRRPRAKLPGTDLDQLAALSHQTTAPTRRVVEQSLEPITASHRSLYHELTSAELEASVASHMNLLTTLLAKATDATLRPLASALGESAGLAAWLYADLGDQVRSRRMYRIAEAALNQGEDWTLSAYVHGFHASMMLDAGQREAALGEFDVADAQAGRGAPPLMTSWLAAMRACAAASVGDHSGARAALRSADVALDRADSRTVPDWMYEFDQGRLTGYRGVCLLWRRQGKAAATALEAALAALPDSCVRRRAELTLDLAYARVFDGEIEDAEDKAGQALETFLACGSVPGIRRISRFHACLVRDGHRMAAANLDARLRNIVPHPGQ